jgi:putative membrane protein
VARQFGWAVEGGHGYFRNGFVGSSTSVFPLFKVQRVDLQQTPLQRRAGVSTLTVHLASHSLTMPYLRMTDAERLRDLALQAAESSRERWF